jgi:hypothetical protein
MQKFTQRPHLVVLASCESAGSRRLADGSALAATGPLLIASGVPAVIAMQGHVSVRTIEQMMPDFFTELRSHGTIDLALAAARRRLALEEEWWAPVLYMRLKSGMLFSLPRQSRKSGKDTTKASQPKERLIPRSHEISQEERERVNRILYHYTWSLPPFDLARYRNNNTNQPHIFSAKVCHYNPFKFDYAEEEFLLPRSYNLFWAEHSCTLKLENAEVPTIVYGMSGSGKSSMAAYLYRRLMISASPRKTHLCVLLPFLTDERALLARAALDVAKLAMRNITHVSTTQYAADLLASFLVEMMGLQPVLGELSSARQTYAQGQIAGASTLDIDKETLEELFGRLEKKLLAAAQQPLRSSKMDWLLQLNTIARALGMQGFRLLLDNVTVSGARKYSRLLAKLYGGVGLTLFTSDENCAAELEITGFVPLPLAWTETQLLDAACHRVNTLCRLLKRGTCPHLAPDGLTPDDFRRDVFTCDAWASLYERSGKCPRLVFHILSYMIENPGSLSPPITIKQVEDALAWSDWLGPRNLR